ncbi:GCN5 family acetyltransferase [Elizabethkingia miricola]|uniref:GCN5 family acetyltransferase n=1 Tax=Elizabethkingia miricola TaxID=172045 RepID=A0AAQ1PGF8_ELIMR|nr:MULTISPECIES: N-acetyltransferase [Elizabethkingia]KUY20737.1 GCN5 family acetyltransferase [Elizabethkingia miricola]MCL1653065.1 N-acetyltransferase [Elizabethkingia miricola]MCL1677851.1 N-acetyltransferase [Elizabethkingia miricola]OPC36929.1 GCN5 family acetyltransferase [Elizabethkingia miricola]OPC70558.1 GCN5 family acetyltransferase [Elizabethkingia miricola]
MNILFRQENKNDYAAVFNLIQRAFEKEEMSDHSEQYLVERLRNSEAFIPELSIVAEINQNIAGHILLTRIKVVNNKNEEFESLALAPVSVLPEYQGKGIGGKLIETAHKKAKELGFGSVILLGHENYYPRFGYEIAKKYGIKLPFEVPDENCMTIELIKGTLEGIEGTVVYPKAFFE